MLFRNSGFKVIKTHVNTQIEVRSLVTHPHHTVKSLQQKLLCKAEVCANLAFKTVGVSIILKHANFDSFKLKKNKP